MPKPIVDRMLNGDDIDGRMPAQGGYFGLFVR